MEATGTRLLGSVGGNYHNLQSTTHQVSGK